MAIQQITHVCLTLPKHQCFNSLGCGRCALYVLHVVWDHSSVNSNYPESPSTRFSAVNSPFSRFSPPPWDLAMQIVLLLCAKILRRTNDVNGNFTQKNCLCTAFTYFTSLYSSKFTLKHHSHADRKDHIVPDSGVYKT